MDDTFSSVVCVCVCVVCDNAAKNICTYGRGCDRGLDGNAYRHDLFPSSNIIWVIKMKYETGWACSTNGSETKLREFRWESP